MAALIVGYLISLISVGMRFGWDVGFIVFFILFLQGERIERKLSG
jgi:hypothetical protein